jgi:hypothetical protein
MSKEIIDNPIESIAQMVRRQFREQSMRDISERIPAENRGRKRRVAIEPEMPMIPMDGRYQGKRRAYSEEDETENIVSTDNESEDAKLWKDDKKDLDAFTPLQDVGSIYDDMPDGTPGEEPLTPEEAALQIALAIRKGHEKGKPDIDWYLVKLLYVYGGWTYERIANECNIAFSLVRLNGRKGRWPEARDAYRSEQAQKVQEKIALEEDRLRDWQILKRRQAGIEGLNWFTKAISNLRDDASPESIAKLGGLMDRMLSSVTGLAPVEGAPGAVNVSVQNNNVAVGNFPANSPQARLAGVWEKKVGETDEEHTRRLALTIRDLYIECERAGLYEDLKLDSESQRQIRLRDRLGLESGEIPIVLVPN